MLLIGGAAPNVKEVEPMVCLAKKKKASPLTGFPSIFTVLAAQAKLTDQVLIGLFITTLDIVKQMATLTDHGQESPA